jgi:hypothetical protein
LINWCLEACEIYVEDSSMVCYFALFFPEYLYRIFMVECCRTGALLFFALLGLSGCFITCYDRRVRNDLAQPCREICLCCCQPGYNSAISTTDAHDINCSHCWIAILLYIRVVNCHLFRVFYVSSFS